MTVRELMDHLREAEPTAEVRVVVYGYERPSINLPAKGTSGGSGTMHYAFNVTAEEPRS